MCNSHGGLPKLSQNKHMFRLLCSSMACVQVIPKVLGFLQLPEDSRRALCHPRSERLAFSQSLSVIENEVHRFTPTYLSFY